MFLFSKESVFKSTFESELEELSAPFGETTIIKTCSEQELFFAVQQYKYSDDDVDFFAVKLRWLGTLETISDVDDSSITFTNIPDMSEYSLWDNTFEVTIDKNQKAIKFGPNSQIGLSNQEFKNKGIGSYGLSLVIRYIQANYKDFKVKHGRLSDADAAKDNFLIRESFYRNHGFKIKYTDDKGNGYFYIESSDHLKENINFKKIQEIGIDGVFKAFAKTSENYSDSERSAQHLLNYCDSLNDDIYRLKKRHRMNLFSIIALVIACLISIAV